MLILALVFNFVGCKSSKEKIMSEVRSFVDVAYSQATYIDSNSENYDNEKAEELKKEARKDKFVRWTGHIVKIENDGHRVYIKEEGLPTIKAGCNYDTTKDGHKEGDLVTISGNIYDFDIGNTNDCMWMLEFGRIEKTTKEDEEALNNYLNDLEKSKKEKEAKELAEQQEIEAKEAEEQKQQEEAKAEAEKVISTDFASFEAPYKQMTDIQKEDYFKQVKGRYVQWTGTVEEVDKNTISVVCLDDTLTMDFVAIVDDWDKETLKNIQKGQPITIKGKISQQEGDFLPWTINTCTLVQ